MKLEEAKSISGTGQNKEDFVADALEVVNLKFVSSIDDIESSAGYAPEFAHQHFGETEKIVGYKNLKVDVLYTDASLFLTSIVKYDEKIPLNSSIQSDDIEYKIKDALPIAQQNAYMTMDKFKQKIAEQRKFQPYGDLIEKFQIEQEGGKMRNFGVYKFDKNENDSEMEEGLKYLERAQSMAFWYIDAVMYTDEGDPRFFNYFLFEMATSAEDGLPCFKFAGYANLYRFYHHPDQDRIRIAQMLVAPPYRQAGLGHRFLQAIYTDLCTTPSVYDITAETPADSFVYMRDYADCVNCAKLAQFERKNLWKGFTAEMWEAAREKYKLNNAQARRVYEILRLFHANLNVASQRDEYRAEVMKRLKRAIVDRKKDRERITGAMADDQSSLAMAMLALDPEQQQQQLEIAYENLMESYKHVIERLVKYERDFAAK